MERVRVGDFENLKKTLWEYVRSVGTDKIMIDSIERIIDEAYSPCDGCKFRGSGCNNCCILKIKGK